MRLCDRRGGLANLLNLTEQIANVLGHFGRFKSGGHGMPRATKRGFNRWLGRLAVSGGQSFRQDFLSPRVEKAGVSNSTR